MTDPKHTTDETGPGEPSPDDTSAEAIAFMASANRDAFARIARMMTSLALLRAERAEARALVRAVTECGHVCDETVLAQEAIARWEEEEKR
jgi:hypothetical protein